jgi:hypothetical protein
MRSIVAFTFDVVGVSMTPAELSWTFEPDVEPSVSCKPEYALPIELPAKDPELMTTPPRPILFGKEI